jgi:hypothetical protein
MPWRSAFVAGLRVGESSCVVPGGLWGMRSMIRTHCTESNDDTARLLKPVGIRDRDAA